MFFIYILYSHTADRYYVGHTNDVARRLKDHNEGERPLQSTKYTFKHRPWKLMASFPISEDRGTTMKVEKYIKGRKSRTFLKELILHQHDIEKIAQLVRVPF